MYREQKILCIITARGGSKRLPGKNVKPLLGKPLIGYAITAAQSSKYIDRVVVSTDDESIAAVARSFGAEVPFMRPPELAEDSSPVIPSLQHAVTFVEEQGDRYDLIVLIQPTVPGVLAQDADATIEKIYEAGTNSAITVCEIVDRPEWMYRMDDGGILSPFKEVATTRSQDMEPLYRVNGAVYAVLRDVLMEQNKLIDKADCAAVIMPRERSADIDTAADFVVAESFLRQANDAH